MTTTPTTAKPRHPPVLQLAEALPQLPAATRPFAERLNLRLLPDDGMYWGGDAHYLMCGASALNTILAALQLAKAPDPGSILDFGAGAGRVTRWLRVAFPEAAIAACELREQDIAFCREQFGAQAWRSGTDIDALAAPGRYDLIWVGSVLTHLSAENCEKLVGKLMSWTNPGGILAMSTIGRYAKAHHERVGGYIHPEGWAAIKQQYGQRGFGYADYPGEDGYGLSLVSASWLAERVSGMAGVRLLLLAERGWDDLHDVFAIQNDAAMPADLGSTPGTADAQAAAEAMAAEIVELRERVRAFEASTSWRITAPLRAIAGIMKG